MGKMVNMNPTTIYIFRICKSETNIRRFSIFEWDTQALEWKTKIYN